MFETKNNPHPPPPLPPCRLYALLARKAPVGVIFRRGPSNWVQIIHWDTDKDIFTPGQWFHGRIYERRSDLSPSGRLLIYSARKPTTRAMKSEEYTDYWTAISKPPYLTALALWPCHSSIGGGLFLNGSRVWLNFYGTPESHPNHKPKGLKVESSGQDILEEPLQLRRLALDGWHHAHEWQGTKTEHGYVTHTPGMLEKPHADQKLTLVMTTTFKGFEHRHSYQVRCAEGERVYLPRAEWADWDRQGRLVYALNGRIFAQTATLIGQEPARELIDLNGNTFEPLEAPEWAKRW